MQDNRRELPTTPLGLARFYITRQWCVVPVVHGQKFPTLKEWQNLRVSAETAHEYFNGQPLNIGIILGAPSGNLIDVDLDCDEAVQLAPHFLPATMAVFGRKSRPQSHYLYYSPAEQRHSFKSPDGEMLLELRSTGCQTVFPGSTHTSGESIDWYLGGPPRSIPANQIADAVERLAAASLLARKWRDAKGSRHDLALAVAGGLARAGCTRESTIRFITYVADAAGDTEIEDRKRAVNDTFQRGDSANVKGWPSVATIIGADSVTRIRKWLGLDAIAATDPYAKGDEDELPLITVTNRLPHLIADETLDKLVKANKPPTVFVRGGKLTRLRDDERGRPGIETLTDTHIREVLSHAAKFVTRSKDKTTTVYPPMQLVQDLRVRASWPGIPILEAITEAPSLRPDGSVLTTPGYDAATRIVYSPSPDLHIGSIPDYPTRADINRALEIVEDVICDMPFIDEASHANAIAALLTPIIRPNVPLAPLALLDAPQAGNGKGLLADVICIVATGRPAPKISLPGDAEEIGKVITSLLADGTTFICFDEVAYVSSHKLALALTATEYAGRILGRSEVVKIPQRATWLAAGNNMVVSGDMPRRCYWIRLDAQTSRPHLRGGFKHDPLEGYVTENRGNILAAILTLARAWYAAGKPPCNARPLGSFQEWSQIIGGILTLAGVKGFLGNSDQLYEQSDDEAAEWEGFIAVCGKHFGDKALTISEIATHLLRAPLRESLPSKLFEAQAAGKGDFKTLIGKALAKRDGRRYGSEGWLVTRDGTDTHKKVALWKFTCAGNVNRNGKSKEK